MKKIVLYIILLSQAVNIYSNSSVDILKNDVSAKVISLAGSNAVTSYDIFSVNYNPATLGAIKETQAAFNQSNGFEDSKYSYISFGTPLPFKVISDFSNPYIGFSAYIANLGDMISRTIDNNGTITEKTISSEKDTVITLSYGEKVYKENNIFISQGLKSNFESGVGLGIKFINSKLLDKYSANTIALDCGYYGDLTDIGAKFGISLSNTMGSIKYIEEKYNLPTILRVGLSYSKPTIMEQSAEASVEFDRYINDKKNSLKLGIEYTIEKIFSVRAGYKFLDDNKGLAVGVGFFAGNFSIDLGTVFYDVYKYSSVSLKYGFGAKEEVKKEKSKELKKFIEKQTPDNKTQLKPKEKSTKDTIIIF